MSPSPFTPIEHETFSLHRNPAPVTCLVLRETHLLKLTRAFKDTFGGHGIFSKPEPILIDLSGIENSGKWVDFPALISLLRNYQLEPIAVLGGNAKQREQAAQAQLPHIEGRPVPEPVAAPPVVKELVAPEPVEPKPAAKEVHAPETERPAHSLEPPMVIRQPVRSGAELYAKQADLIVISMVGAGARVVADGSIYVHGALKGTAAAGVNGMPQARIFCESFEPEIIAINGIYLDGEQLAKHPAWGKRVLIELDQKGQLDIRVFI
ncbi:septum site-determining protein MinC [Halothiobacillus neapolitanus]|uniref:Probable septum site-determining protein MinC n=1 Tax=Halothiobacillus neapolitanus (strain ATCC 23641 / DSM 15147 / CIP 104769 / NCIMB 8539 / c2) TaxID=555778 RepID=D0KYI4_HALNC|nr:septum site-determining protein MinC [Halothiobacillus neapolitanus]ACX95507.1 septum site-determining protein MinC [Halothiobacillus neapolitanus c2]TDN65804.1 septum site-determining protein MinC [Halothiobacillus neapolitanus]